MQIVIAKVEMTGLRPTGRSVRFDGVNYRPQFEPAPEAKAAMWLRNGTDADVEKAISANARDGWKVYTFDKSERDPLGKARAAALKSI